MDADVDEIYLKSKNFIVLDYFEQITVEVFRSTSTNKDKLDIDGVTDIINNTKTSQATQVESKEDTSNITKSTITSKSFKDVPIRAKNEDITEYSGFSFVKSEGKIDASKIFSASLVDHTILYDILVHFSEKTEATEFNINPYLSVLVCIDNETIGYDHVQKFKNFSKDSVFIFENCTKVADYSKHNILAALIPKPLPNEDGTSIPVIFYETSELDPEHKMVYPNSVTLHQNYSETLKYGIAEYFKKKNWNRIAVVSDNALNSDKFEQNLHEIFNKNNILNTIKSCSTIQCDFNKDLEDLKEANVR